MHITAGLRSTAVAEPAPSRDQVGLDEEVKPMEREIPTR